LSEQSATGAQSQSEGYIDYYTEGIEQAPDNSPPVFSAGYYDNSFETTRECLRSPFGEYLKEKREAIGITHCSVLSKRAGLAGAHAHHIESGYYHPRPATARKLAYALDVPFEELWEQCQRSRATWGRKRQSGGYQSRWSIARQTYLPREDDDWITEICQPAPGRRGRSRSRVIGDIVARARRQAEAEAHADSQAKDGDRQ